MKRILLIAFMFVTAISFAQTKDTTYWTTKGNVTFNFTQAYYNNWSAGGENSFAGMPKLNYTATYEKGKIKWFNALNLALGYTVTGKSDPMKTDDIIEFNSLAGYKLSEHWLATFMLKFNTQFAKGFDYGVDSSTYISKFMAPAYLDFGPGVAYNLPDWLVVNFSPLDARFTFVNDERLADAGTFGLDPAEYDANGVLIAHAKKMKFQFGAKLTVMIEKEIFENVVLGTSLELFSDYLHNPQNVIVNWKTLLRFKVNPWLNVDFNTELFYDDNIMFYDVNGIPEGPKVQFKQNLMVGLSVNL